MVRFLTVTLILLVLVALAGAGGGLWVFYHYGRGLPDYRQLAEYEPPVTTRVHAGDGRLLIEYAKEKRVFVPIESIPKRVVQAVLSAEDKDFYVHPGVNFLSVARAAVTNLRNLGSNRRPVGASTITQQVAKNFLLTNEVSITRKAKEAILAFRIERTFSKQRILELYLNEIYLGFGAYGVAAASQAYFDKALNELTIAEAAFLGALPKAPANYHPYRHPQAAKERRDWVIGRMLEDGAISADQAAEARATPLTIRQPTREADVDAGHFTEEVRREIAERYGENALYQGGLLVRSTVNPKLQDIAARAVRDGLIAYDRRHGWRGPMAHLEPAAAGAPAADWRARLAATHLPAEVPAWKPALVTRVDGESAAVMLADGAEGTIPLRELRWAREQLGNQTRGPRIRAATEVLKPGDVVAVEAVSEYTVTDKGEEVAKEYPAGTYALRQVPEIDGGLVAMDPHTGRVLAMVGGFSFDLSKFNRATQAKRQPGSAFKPIVYLAALDKGFTPATRILDAPFVIDQGPGLPKWRPANYTKKFYGPSTMRLGIEKSRNLMTVRLAQTIGMETVVDYARRFGVVTDMPETLSMALGAGETTLLDLTTAYAMIVNGGKKITPTLIDRVQDRTGATVFRHDLRACPQCRAEAWNNQPVPIIPDTREQVTDPASAYQMVSMLNGVVQRGTGRRIRSLGIPLAGKTGTTNDSNDTWFIGFSPDLAVGVFAGFDTPRSLGKLEQGASVAAPIFKEFMHDALADKPAVPFRIPPGIRLVRIDAATGRLAQTGDRDVILEAFKPGTVPTGNEEILEGVVATGGAPTSGTGGLY
ncbi:MAG: penicillin-binding protein 1A [Hyphomicrobiales bacterium]|nr:penicillin-binding protein 1A [Hyphomicrobiales bacterium]